MYEYIACYAKNFKLSPPFSVDVTTAGKKYPLNNSGNSLSTLLFPSGSVTFSKKNETYYPCDMSEGNILTELLDKVQVVEYKNVNEFRLKGEFRYSQSRLNEIIESNDVLTITKSPFRPNHVRSGGEIKKMHNHLSPSTYNVGTNEDASSELEEILGGDFFDNPKPFSLVSTLCKAVTHDDLNSVVFDFFSGSGTTAHAVMELNAEDGGNRQSISVQLPEKLEENSEAYKAGYRTIADITRARIEKVIAKLKAEHPEKTEGLACANFTLAPSNFKVWNSDISDPGAIRQQLDALQNTEKHADEQTAMLTELLLKNGLGALGVHAVSKPRKLACGVTVHRVLREDDRYLWLCFEPYVDALRDEIVSASPAQVIMLNSCFVGTQGDEQLSNLQLELAAQDINLLVI